MTDDRTLTAQDTKNNNAVKEILKAATEFATVNDNSVIAGDNTITLKFVDVNGKSVDIKLTPGKDYNNASKIEITSGDKTSTIKLGGSKGSETLTF
ncbi:hypothetical protein [Campylobacter pinnipediorum]|uniref:hypothetical protein n=1 Tax=Campylobacter pinnipediorum TaxID=1965231 RepID=UPI00112FC46D|nr:hypothetical protein [Campylobacter pinnipediorum]